MDNNTKIIRFEDLEDKDIEQAKIIQKTMLIFIQRMMVKGIDYGTIPYCGNREVLFKPGAEKLLRLFKLRPHFDLVDKIVDYREQLFHYHYRCSLYRFGDLVGQGDGLANSKEKKFISRKGFDFSVVNTICKVATKRALIAAVLIVCGASEVFTQDLEDYN